MIQNEGRGNLGFTVSYSIAKDSKHKSPGVHAARATSAARRACASGRRTSATCRRGATSAPPTGAAMFLKEAPSTHAWQFAPGFSSVVDTANSELAGRLRGQGERSRRRSRTSRTRPPKALRRAAARPELTGSAARPSAARGGSPSGGARGGGSDRGEGGQAEEVRDRRQREAARGARRLRLHRHPDGVLLRSSSSSRSATPSTSASSTGGSSGRSSTSGFRTTATSWHDKPVLDVAAATRGQRQLGLLEHPLLHRRSSSRRRWRSGSCLALDRERADPRQDVLPRAPTTSRR